MTSGPRIVEATGARMFVWMMEKSFNGGDIVGHVRSEIEVRGA